MGTWSGPYDADPGGFADRWESVSFQQVHQAWMHLLPEGGGLALEVGAGSGRDAAFLAQHGFEVFAVEPSQALRDEARRRHTEARIHWLEDSLPDLGLVHQQDCRFDLILLSAVWMFLAPGKRERAFRKLSELLKPGGLLVFTVKHGAFAPDRKTYEVDDGDLEKMARRRALLPVPLPGGHPPDALGRSDVRWTTLVFRAPDDGTEALPLLRHIIVNDSKSATHKLALLRVLVRIADGARGMVLERSDSHVVLPLGLVGLYWLKAFKPLLFPEASTTAYPQATNPNKGLGFVKEGFLSLAGVSPHDFSAGQTFVGPDSTHFVAALRDACRNIRDMPVRYTTMPGSDAPVFRVDYHSVRVPRNLRVTADREFLGAFGTFHVPIDIWDAMSRFACWIEPAIIEEWVDKMRRYDGARKIERPEQEYRRVLTWLEPERNTGLVRTLIDGMREEGQPLFCVWSGRRLRGAFEVDHGLPFAIWPNNDLWNLMPASRTANQRKSDQLPSAELLDRSGDRIVDWWRRAYQTYALFDRYRDEAFTSLPLAALWFGTGGAPGRPSDPDAICHAVLAGLENQRIRLLADQQVREWDGLPGTT